MCEYNYFVHGMLYSGSSRDTILTLFAGYSAVASRDTHFVCCFTRVARWFYLLTLFVRNSRWVYFLPVFCDLVAWLVVFNTALRD